SWKETRFSPILYCRWPVELAHHLRRHGNPGHPHRKARRNLPVSSILPRARRQWMWTLAYGPPRRPHTDLWLRGDARGRDGSVRKELAAGIGPPRPWRKKNPAPEATRQLGGCLLVAC